MSFKQPISVLVVIHTGQGEVLLLERARQPGLWQSVTGSREGNEALIDTACREVWEETGIVVAPDCLQDWQIENTYEIFPAWRQRYGPGITHNTEHVFALPLPGRVAIQLAADEHRNFRWLPAHAAESACFSWSNRDAIRLLGGCRATQCAPS